MSTSTIARHYTRILSQWPKDALRPDLPFLRAVEYRAAAYGVKPITPPAPPPKKKKNDKSAVLQPAVALDPRVELANINALYSLLENRYSKQNVLSPEVLKPASNPAYYDRVMEEIERAPKKSWLQAKLDQWKGKIRWE